jgi:hypothetical protein
MYPAMQQETDIRKSLSAAMMEREKGRPVYPMSEYKHRNTANHNHSHPSLLQYSRRDCCSYQSLNPPMFFSPLR